MSLMDPGIPGNADAATRYMQFATSSEEETVRNVCRVGLAAVGRQVWDNSHTGLAKTSSTVDFSIKMNCYTAVLYWAMLGGGLSRDKAKKYSAACDKAKTPDATNKAAQALIYDSVKRCDYGSGAYCEPGAMVFHGRKDNPIAHVSLSVGNRMVVSCWALQYTSGDSIKNQVLDLSKRGWSGDTVFIPLNSFGTDYLAYTDGPFWKYW